MAGKGGGDDEECKGKIGHRESSPYFVNANIEEWVNSHDLTATSLVNRHIQFFNPSFSL